MHHYGYRIEGIPFIIRFKTDLMDEDKDYYDVLKVFHL